MPSPPNNFRGGWIRPLHELGITDDNPSGSDRRRPGPDFSSSASHTPQNRAPLPSAAASSGSFAPYRTQPQQSLPPIGRPPHVSPMSQPSHGQSHAAGPHHRSYGAEVSEREAREVHIKEEQDAAARRERDIRDRQMLDQHMHGQPAQSGMIQLHQPVAVGPRTVHGPNGLLGNPAVAGQPLPPHPMNGQPLPGYAPAPPPPAYIPAPPPPAAALPPAASANAAGNQPVPAGQVTAGQQPILNDALSYLDQVKVQFSTHPDVYNRFLDIMKDFKSGAIDTPGVIDRVSTLFNGHPDLIQGFNTFLPPGYRIECGAGDDPNAIRVTTPMGNTLMSMAPAQRASSREPETSRDEEQGQTGPSRGNGAWTPQPAQQATMSPLNQPAGPASPAAALIGADGTDANGDLSDDKKEPLEFNHAINYVNKIKNRFASQPEIYKSFLDILQTYQRESRPIGEVYEQVTKLFESAPDLLEDFKQFLPETSAKAKAAASARRKAEENVATSNLRGEPAKSNTAQLQKTPRAEHRLPPVGNFAPTPTVPKDHKRKRGDTKSGIGSISSEVRVGLANATSSTGNPAKKAKPSSSRPVDAAPLSPTLVPALPEPLPPTTKSGATSDELGFFDRVKKVIANKNTMNEFLKLCNLFSQDLIDKTTLVYRAKSFIGNNQELFKWFQNWLGYEDEGAVVIENRARPPTGRVMLSNCRGLGPSYRLLPKRERLKPCSGRDELCNSVLNDDWASHPTWASEDSGFIAHRKNVHEEGLHKIEEERHDYDFHIEACGRTIQLLEPFAQQLLRMSERERETFEIPPGIGGQSETIHKRIIMKVYGRVDGQDVIEALHLRPYAVIPILLNRLKQKHEEWKNAQREWEKVWRDQTQKIFWKSLDHQAVNAKQADKRQFQTKTLLSEIQTKYEEQKKIRLLGGTLAQVTKPQLLFHVEDIDVVADACSLVLTYADQLHSTDYPRLTSFIREFIPQFFGLDIDWFNHQIRVKMGSLNGEEGADEIMSNFDESNGPKRRAPAKKEDLRRGVLSRGKGRNDGGATPLSRASTPDNASRADEEMSEAADVPVEDLDVPADTWADYPPGFTKYQNRDINLNEPFRRTIFNLYGNTSIYCFVRMFVILYERLSRLKDSEAEVKETVKRAMMGKPALELGLVDKQPADFFADVSPTANFYTQVLGMFSDLVRNNDMEMPHIEETLRRYYLQCGWQLYSVDKLLSALVRFAIAIMSSEARDRSWEVLQLFKKDRVKDETTYQEEMNYRKQAERLIREGDTYKISYDQEKQEIGMKVFRKDEPTFETSQMLAEDVWRVYVTDFLNSAPTHGVALDNVSVPVLKRSVRSAQDRANAGDDVDGSQAVLRRFDTVKAKEALEFRISVGEYKMNFSTDPQTNEEFWHQPLGARTGAQTTIDEADETRNHREERIAEVLVMNNEAMKGLSKADVERKNEAFGVLRHGPGTGGRDQEVGDDGQAETMDES